MTLDEKIKALPGPVLVLGAGGFVGANILRTLLAVRDDVYGTVTDEFSRRYRGANDIEPNLINLNGNKHIDVLNLYKGGLWHTVFNCIAYGAYSWQYDVNRVYSTNFDLTRRIVEDFAKSDIKAYVHAGSSSEYGTNCSGPTEHSHCFPNSHYAVSKLTATEYLKFIGGQGFPYSVLRLASVYGPLEDPKRFIPQVVEQGLLGKYPPLVNPYITRDFVHVLDVVKAFVDAALFVAEGNTGHIFNIGSGEPTSILDVAKIANKVFDIEVEPEFTMPKRDWDHGYDWYLNVDKAREYLGWETNITLEKGIKHMAELAVKQNG